MIKTALSRTPHELLLEIAEDVKNGDLKLKIMNTALKSDSLVECVVRLELEGIIKK